MDNMLSYQNYKLVFEDNFDGPVLDRSRWNVEIGRASCRERV